MTFALFSVFFEFFLFFLFLFLLLLTIIVRSLRLKDISEKRFFKLTYICSNFIVPVEFYIAKKNSPKLHSCQPDSSITRWIFRDELPDNLSCQRTVQFVIVVPSKYFSLISNCWIYPLLNGGVFVRSLITLYRILASGSLEAKLRSRWRSSRALLFSLLI